jgi:2-polyprenyl-3-methyl-5-hydroxy-6-metoxy-1,4-benzoquinol methylase
MENQKVNDSDFTGEFFIPGKTAESLEKEHMERYLFASKYVKNKTILDIACGVGYAAPMLVEAGALSYEGVDINKGNIEHANRLYGSDCARFFVGDICTFDNGKVYDLIVCYETIEHIKKYRAALKNLHRLLNRNGFLIISSPNRILASPNALSIADRPDNKFHS